MVKKETHFSQYFNILFLILVCLSMLILRRPSDIQTTSSNAENRTTIVIDAGHGGNDPGKVGINHALEKDINLSIALKLKMFLEANDLNVIMTREEDKALYSEGVNNKKSSDMRKRVELINNSNAVLAISIHQNSYTSESIKGAQVFYYNNASESKMFAEIMQDQIKRTINDGNKRVAKKNNNYYLLKKTAIPTVIVECGFLSNYTEASLLVDDGYQEKLAWAIHLGIMSYLNQSKAN